MKKLYVIHFGDGRYYGHNGTRVRGTADAAIFRNKNDAQQVIGILADRAATIACMDKTYKRAA